MEEKRDSGMLICPAIYYIDIIEVCGWKKERLKNGKLPPAYRPIAMFSSAFFKISIVLHPSIRPSNNAALSTIREGFSTFHVPISPPPWGSGHDLALVVRSFFNIHRVAAEIEGWNWKKPCINCWMTPDAWTSVVFLVLRYIDRGFGC